MRFLWFSILFCWLTNVTLAAELPAHIEIEYTLKGLIGQGKALETLDIQEKDGAKHYTISSTIAASGFLSLIKQGSIVRHSTGVIIPQQGIKPHLFTDQRGNKPIREAEFHWEEQRILYRRKGREMIEDLPANTIDELSLPYNFMFSSLPDQTVIVMHETNYKKQRTLHFTISHETLKTPIGELTTVVLTKQQDSNDSFRKKIWLAPDYHFLPVRIIATEKGGLEVDQMIKKINYSAD